MNEAKSAVNATDMARLINWAKTQQGLIVISTIQRALGLRRSDAQHLFNQAIEKDVLVVDEINGYAAKLNPTSVQ